MNTSDLAEARRLAKELTVWARDYATTDYTDEMASKSAVSLLFLADEVERLQRDLARAHDSANGFVAEIGMLKQQAREHRAFQAMVNRHAPEFPADPDGPRDVWYWQGDGGDHLESMVHQLPIVIRAEQLRELLAAQVPCAA